LEKLKTEKTIKIKGTTRPLVEGPSNTTYKPIDIEDQYHPGPQKADEWLFLSDFTLSLNLLADFKISKNIGTFPDIQSNS